MMYPPHRYRNNTRSPFENYLLDNVHYTMKKRESQEEKRKKYKIIGQCPKLS